jgi:hypothetical protein
LSKPHLEADDRSKDDVFTRSAPVTSTDGLRLAATFGGVVVLAYPELDGYMHLVKITSRWFLIVRAGKTAKFIDSRRSQSAQDRCVTLWLRLPIGRGRVILEWADGKVYPMDRQSLRTGQALHEDTRSTL